MLCRHPAQEHLNSKVIYMLGIDFDKSYYINELFKCSLSYHAWLEARAFRASSSAFEPIAQDHGWRGV